MCPPRAIAGQPSSCAGVGPSKACSNQARVSGEKTSSASTRPTLASAASARARHRRSAMTYSIVARDPETGELRCRRPVTGRPARLRSCRSARAGVGVRPRSRTPSCRTARSASSCCGPASSTSSRHSPSSSPRTRSPNYRQVAILDTEGRVAVLVGEACIPAPGFAAGDWFSAQANLVESERVWESMAEPSSGRKARCADRRSTRPPPRPRAGTGAAARRGGILVDRGRRRAWAREFDLRVDDHLIRSASCAGWFGCARLIAPCAGRPARTKRISRSRRARPDPGADLRRHLRPARSPRPARCSNRCWRPSRAGRTSSARSPTETAAARRRAARGLRRVNVKGTSGSGKTTFAQGARRAARRAVRRARRAPPRAELDRGDAGGVPRARASRRWRSARRLGDRRQLRGQARRHGDRRRPTRSSGSTCRSRLKLRRRGRRTTERIRDDVELWNGNKETWRNALWGRESLFAWMIRGHFRHRRDWPRLYAGDPRFVRLRSVAEARRWLDAQPAILATWPRPQRHRHAPVQRHRGLDPAACAGPATAYPELLERHRTLLREAFERHGGHVLGTEGDEFFVAFESAGDAAAAAADGQRALAGHDWPGRQRDPRAHGPAHRRAAAGRTAATSGLDVHHAARVMAAGHGGQVLVSQATRALLGRTSSSATSASTCSRTWPARSSSTSSSSTACPPSSRR